MTSTQAPAVFRVPEAVIDRQLTLSAEVERRLALATGPNSTPEQQLAAARFVMLNLRLLDFGQHAVAQRALALISDLVDRYYPPAQFYFACLLIAGIAGFPRRDPDYVRAFSLFYLAATKGHVDAMYHLALCYQFGRGTCDVDAPRAIKWLKRAAAANHPGALYKLSQTGRKRNLGLKLTEAKSLELMQRAADRADLAYCKATFRLARYYIGVADIATARRWLLRGEELGQRDCIAELGFCHLRRDRSAMFPFSIASAQQYFDHARDLGSAGACFGRSLVFLLLGDTNAAFVAAMEASTRGDYRGDYVVGYLGLLHRQDQIVVDYNRHSQPRHSQHATGLSFAIDYSGESQNADDGLVPDSLPVGSVSSVVPAVLRDRDTTPLIPAELVDPKDRCSTQDKIVVPNPLSFLKRALDLGGDLYAEAFLNTLSTSYAPGVAPAPSSLSGSASLSSPLRSPLERRDIEVLDDEVDWDELAALTHGEEILLKDAKWDFNVMDHVA